MVALLFKVCYIHNSMLNKHYNPIAQFFADRDLHSVRAEPSPINKSTASTAGNQGNDPTKIQHRYASHTSSDFAAQYRLAKETRLSRESKFTHILPGTVDKNKDLGLHSVGIDWIHHEMIMSDGSRIAFGQKLSLAEQQYGANKRHAEAQQVAEQQAAAQKNMKQAMTPVVTPADLKLHN